MPTNNPRLSFMLQPELLDSIEEYKTKSGFKSLSQAVVSLLSLGLFEQLNAQTEQKVYEPLSLEEKSIIDGFRLLDTHGQRAVLAILDIELQHCSMHNFDDLIERCRNLSSAIEVADYNDAKEG